MIAGRAKPVQRPHDRSSRHRAGRGPGSGATVSNRCRAVALRRRAKALGARETRIARPPVRTLAGVMTGESGDGEPGESSAADALAAEKRERARVKKAAKGLGWKLIGRDDRRDSVRAARCTSGRARSSCAGAFRVPLPAEMTRRTGRARGRGRRRSVARPSSRARSSGPRAKILSEPDDVEQTGTSTRSPSFFSALEDARRGLVQCVSSSSRIGVSTNGSKPNSACASTSKASRAKRASFEYFVGPTNSGKTHAAIEILREARKRHLPRAAALARARSATSASNDLGVAGSLVTGEERIINPRRAPRQLDGRNGRSQRASSTLRSIDEAQMLAGRTARLGVDARDRRRAREARRPVRLGGGARSRRNGWRQRLGAALTVRRFERKNPLHVVACDSAAGAARGRRRDRLLAQRGRRDCKARFGRLGFSSAAIYGSLSPRGPAPRGRTLSQRRGRHAGRDRRDRLGLELADPADHLRYAREIRRCRRRGCLTPHEIRQIAGRAGRYGIHEEGLVTALDPRARRASCARASNAHEPAPSADRPIWISPTDEHLRRLSAIIGTNARQPAACSSFRRACGARKIPICASPTSATRSKSRRRSRCPTASSNFRSTVRCTYSRAPVSTRGNSLAILARWGDQHADRRRRRRCRRHRRTRGARPAAPFEDRSRLATLYLWLAQRFPEVYIDGQSVMLVREQLDDDIHDALLQHGERPRREHKPAAFVRRTGPPKFNKRRLPK